MANYDVEAHTHTLSVWPRTHIPGTELCFFFLAPYARTTREAEAFLSLENQGRKGSLRSRLIKTFQVNTQYKSLMAFLFFLGLDPAYKREFQMSKRVRVIPIKVIGGNEARPQYL